jgi:hypothetical protein
MKTADSENPPFLFSATFIAFCVFYYKSFLVDELCPQIGNMEFVLLYSDCYLLCRLSMGRGKNPRRRIRMRCPDLVEAFLWKSMGQI